MKVHFYVRQGKIIPIFEDMTKTFHLPSEVKINDWDDYYKKTEYYDTALCKVENNITVDWITFKSLSGTTSFIYGKPCDIKKSIKFSRVLSEDEEKVVVNYITKRDNIFEKIYQSGESFADVLWKRTNSFNILDITDEEILKEDKEVRNIDNMANAVKDLSPMEKLGLATSLDVKAKSEIVAMEIGKQIREVLTPLAKVDDSSSIIRRYSKSLQFYDKSNTSELFKDSNNKDLLYTRLADFLERISFIQPVYLLGSAGVGKNVLEEQLVHRLTEKYGAYVGSISFDSSITQADTTVATSPLTDKEKWGIYTEAIIKANELWGNREIPSDLTSYTPDCELVIVLGNEFSRQCGDTMAKLLTFLSTRGAEIEIDGKIYYNTPNLILFFNGNTEVNGEAVGSHILQDGAWSSRMFMYELTGIFYLNPRTGRVETDIYDRIMANESNYDKSFVSKLDTIINKLDLDKDYRNCFPFDCKVNLRDVTRISVINSIAEELGF